MKTTFNALFIGLALLAGIHEADAQSAQFFRIVGPTVVTITAFRADGTMVWSGATPGATYTVQTLTSLSGGTNWVNFVQFPVTQAVNTNLLIDFNPPAGMSLIPDGSFTMGDTLDGESDAIPTNIYVSAFYMDVNLVSSNQWAEVYSFATSHGYSFMYAGSGKAGNHPAQTMDWYDCVKWSNARSQQAGLTPVYYTDAGFTLLYTNGDDGTTVYANFGANGYRLPTEAEWEKAARGGLSGQRFPWGNTISWSQANYYGNPLSLHPGGYAYDLATAIDYDPAFSGGDNMEYPYTSPVGSFAPNGYGLYDMGGNIFERCWDLYGIPYGQPTNTNPTGAAGPESGYHVLRGGGWAFDASFPRCAARGRTYPTNASYYYGFRCVRGL